MWDLRQETYTAFLAATAAVRDEAGRTLRIMAGVVPPLPPGPDEQESHKLVSRLAEQSALAGSAIQASAASVRSMNSAQARVLIAGPSDAVQESQAAVQAARDAYNVLLKEYDAGVFQGLEEPVEFRDALSRLRVGEESFAVWSQSVLGTRPASVSRVRWWRK